MWYHHPGMRQMRGLVTMEVESEITEMLTLFSICSTKLLSITFMITITNFTRTVIMTDDVGTNLQCLRDAMGFDYL